MIRKRLWSLMLVTMTCLILTVTVHAQPGGGRGGDGNGRGDGRGRDHDNDGNPTSVISALNVGIPETWTDVSLPNDLPTSSELVTLIDDANLPFPLDSLTLPASDATAYANLVGFADTYLGTTIDPLFATTLGMVETQPDNRNYDITDLSDELASISTELPDEIAAILASAEGIAYWGIYENGAGAVFRGEDCGAECLVTVDNIQVTLIEGIFGVYSTYTDERVTDELEARMLILDTYPDLSSYSFDAYDTVENGFAFTGSNIAQSQNDNFAASGFVAGVVAGNNGQSLVYVAFGVGDIYVNLIR
ncbi:MAG: hypothetical protein AAFV98_16625 [Chloroflexota bacterium]